MASDLLVTIQPNNSTPIKFRWLTLTLKRKRTCGSEGGEHVKYYLSARVDDSVEAEKWWCSVKLSYGLVEPSTPAAGGSSGGGTTTSSSARKKTSATTTNRQFHKGRLCQPLTIFSDVGAVSLHIFLNDGREVAASAEANLRFTDPIKAAELQANCKLIFDDDETAPLHVNRELLQVYSPVFRSMFGTDFVERGATELRLHEIRRADFLMFLNCVYHPNAQVGIANVSAVYEIADRFLCASVMEECKNFLGQFYAITVYQYKVCIEFFDRHKCPASLGDYLEFIPHAVLANLLDREWLNKLSATTADQILATAKDWMMRTGKYVAKNVRCDVEEC